MNDHFRIESISQVHAMLGQEKPGHPPITILTAAQTRSGEDLPEIEGKVINDPYFVGMKNGTECQFTYGRQFLTRSCVSRDTLAALEGFLDQWFSTGESGQGRMPTVKTCAERMGYSPGYFSDLPKKETGMSAQEHIHARLIDRAKDLLLATRDPVNRIAFNLGFGYPQHFSKLFKNRTGLTPDAFRRGSEA